MFQLFKIVHFNHGSNSFPVPVNQVFCNALLSAFWCRDNIVAC
jgi:hypothetical protein